LLVVVLLVLIGSFYLLLQRRAELLVAAPMDDRQWTGSAACESCHSDRHASWYRTYHRTMTQEAGPQSVLRQFDGQRLEADGTVLRPVQYEGGYAFEYLDSTTDEVIGRVPIMRTVGSHRYQQYLGRAAGNDYRLEFLWHIGEQRWVPLNAAFLHPDGLPGDHSVSLWNQNCIYCHNTGPEPRIQNYPELAQRARDGAQIDINRESRYASAVAELGIGCEACHGPGSQHVQRTASVLDRTLLQVFPSTDPAIVLADKLDATRSSQICAQCHAQRLPIDTQTMLAWLQTGPTYRPGDDLDQHVKVVQIDTPTPDPRNPDLYRLRFWADGSPRLSAYEWQGMSRSACFSGAELSCLNCHAMHAGDPAGMQTARQASDAPCLACHREVATDTVAHTRHPTNSEGARCQSCHMPYQVYGVMSIQRSHDISIPDASRSLSSGAPNACTGCHSDQTPQWVQQQLHTGWARPSIALPQRIDDAPLQRADALAGLLAGDAAQQAIWAERIGAVDTGLSAQSRAVLIPGLMEALASDYPSTRRFTLRSLENLATQLSAAGLAGSDAWLQQLQEFDYVAPRSTRSDQLLDLRSSWLAIDKSTLAKPVLSAHCVDPQWQVDAGCMDALLRLGARSDRQISIGE
jgi:5-methylcytosine-specific restriction endonuclease McrA